MHSTSDFDACDKVEKVLLAHPFVGRASVFAEKQSAGQRYLIAYVVPSNAWTEARKSQTYQAYREKRVTQWQRVFDRTYNFHDDCEPGFVGWTDSYTNSAIPESEMQEWLAATIQRITALRPKRLYEIGCGVGLLTQALAPRCETYRGSDFSPTAISRLQRFIDTQPQLSQVGLSRHEATDFDDIRPNSLDMVVLNSVIQYFPNLAYLLEVLEGAARSVVPGGHIFVGDVRHFGLLKILHSSVQFAKASPGACVRSLKQRIALAVEQESELAVDPRFFLALSQRDWPIAGAEILLKRGRAHNELTRYRYDVVLRVGKTKDISSHHEIGWHAGDVSIGELKSRFRKHRVPTIRITGVANQRIARDLAVTRALCLADEKQSMRGITEKADALENIGVDPETIWQSQDFRDYDVSVGWSAESHDGDFDITLTDREQCSDSTLVPYATSSPSCIASTPLATDPLAVADMNKLGLELGEMLRTRFPEALLPAAVIVTTKMPAVSS